MPDIDLEPTKYRAKGSKPFVTPFLLKHRRALLWAATLSGIWIPVLAEMSRHGFRIHGGPWWIGFALAFAPAIIVFAIAIFND